MEHAKDIAHSPNPPVRGFCPVVVVPVYNHAASLPGVLRGVARLGLPIVVVNDGSSDDTQAAVPRWVAENRGSALTLRTHPSNRGKAAALQTGFDAAAAMGATHAVTIDADGQLDPADAPGLLELARANPRALVLGTRPETIDACPPRCLVGRRFANFAISLQAGLRLGDSQCGFRVYPLDLVRSVRCAGGRYTFEAEIITRARWAGFPVLESPVRCRYFTDADRVSHFRPWRDSWAQAFMHIRLVLLALVPWPRATHGGAPRRAQSRLLDWFDPLRAWRNARGSHLGRLELAAALGFGVWVGMWPIWGLQGLPALYFAWRLHLHPAWVLLGTLIALPPVGAAIGAVSGAFGRLVLAGWRGEGPPGPMWESGAGLLGGVVLGFAVGMAAFWIGVALARCVPLASMRGAALPT